MPSLRRRVLLVVVWLLTAPAAPAEEPDWPQFRGPRGDGSATAERLPATWSEAKNVRWKTPIHDRGWSSPILWQRQIWLTTATEDGHKLYAVAVDRESGKVLHDLLVFEVAQPQPIHALNSYASCTGAVEDGRVYVHFGCYGTACLDTATGRKLWERRDLKCDHFRGPGSSLLLWKDRLICTFDGIDVQYLCALDPKTGETLWKTGRSTDFGKLDGDLRKAYSTPLALEMGGQPQIISPGAGAAMAYDPRDGRELWRLAYAGGYSNTVRPVVCGNLVLINTGFDRPQLWGVRLGGSGALGEDRVAWKYDRNVPRKPSPVVHDGLLYVISDSGMATCLEAATGRQVWTQRMGGNYSASPIVAAGAIYFFSHEGKCTVIRPGREYHELAVNQLDEGCMASPAVVGKALYVRTKTHLYRIEE